MKIGIIGSRGIPNNYGGYEQFATFLSQALVQRGHDVYVYNSSLHPYKNDEWNGVKIIRCKDLENKIGTAGQFIYDRNCLTDARKRGFDVLLHLGYTSDSVWHRLWPKNTVNIVNMDGLEWKRRKYNRLTRYFLKKAEALAAKHADVLVADSPVIQQTLMENYQRQSVCIPYAASVFSTPDAACLAGYNVGPHQYFLAIARMEPENNIEMIIQGYILSGGTPPLLIIGNTSNRFGRYLVSKYKSDKIIFTGALFDNEKLNNLRYYSQLYFHGHSVGGTNPSLLEAMGCGCFIAAHNNPFNKAVLGNNAVYFSSAGEIAGLVKSPSEKRAEFTIANLEKIKTEYNNEKIANDYEKLMIDSCKK